MKKLLIAILFCLMMSIAPSRAELDFPDVQENHWAYNNVKILKNLGIIVGYPDGNFRPDEFVTRAEFSSMAVKALKLLNAQFTPVEYKDVTPAHWGYKNIQIASNYGLVSGHTGGYFLPDDNVKRVEVISVIMNSLNLEELTNEEAIKFLADYQDANLTPNWAIVKTAQAKKMDMVVIGPGREGFLEPLRPATRGELAVFLTKMMDAFAKTPSEKISQEVEAPKTLKLYDGYVVESAYIDGNQIIIPAGTILPMAIIACTQSEKTQTGKDFRARNTKNFITKDKRLIIPVGSNLYGVFKDVKKPVIFWRNSSLTLASDTLRNSKTDVRSPFNSVAYIVPKYRGQNIFQKINFYIIKGKTTPLHKSTIEEFILLEPIKVELVDEWITL